jgi:tRNA (adenine37-N6)-methyltransferase
MNKISNIPQSNSDDPDFITYHPIGILHTPYKTLKDMPIQPGGALGVRGKLLIKPEFAAGLIDLEGFSHIYLIYHFHKVYEYHLTVKPFLDDETHGLFSTRAPKRPNPIGLSVVRLLSITENILILENVDILDGTPILDIKPYVPAFDQPENVSVGWLTGKAEDVKIKRSDERFV